MVLVVVETLFQDFLERNCASFIKKVEFFATIISDTLNL